MKPFVILVLLALTSVAIPVQGDQYLTEAQKELLLEKSRALGLASENKNAQNASKQSEQTSIVKQQSRPVKSRQTAPIYLGMTSTHPTSNTSSVVNNAQTQTQSIQSQFKNADWGKPTYSGRPIRQKRNTTYVASTTDWSNFYRKQLQLMGLTNRATNYPNTQYRTHVPQLNYLPQRNLTLPIQSGNRNYIPTAIANTRCSTDMLGNTNCTGSDGTTMRGSTDILGNETWRNNKGNTYHGTTDILGNKTYRDNQGGTLRGSTDILGNETWRSNSGNIIRGSTDMYGNRTYRDSSGNITRCSTDMYGNTTCR